MYFRSSGTHKKDRGLFQYCVKKVNCHTINLALYTPLLQQEINIVGKLDHPFIARSYGSYEHDMQLYTIFEYCSGQELLTHSFTEEAAKPVIYQILLALSYLCSCRIVHRDVNPQNILFEAESPSSPVKLIDFGMAYKYAKNDEEVIISKLIVGSAGFTARESYCMVPSFSFKSDVFSVGATLYFMLTGVPIFRGSHLTLSSIFNSNGININFQLPQLTSLSANGLAFLKRLLDYNTIKRPNATSALNDKWFSELVLSKPVKYHMVLVKNTLRKLSAYSGYDDVLVHLIKLVMVRYLKTTNLAEHVQAYVCLDRDKDGEISRGDLAGVCGELGEEVEINFQGYRRKKEVLTYSDFLVATLDPSVFKCPELISRAFYMMTMGGNAISYSSMCETSRVMRYKLRFVEMGNVSLEELISMMH
jgi:serine/threonine protein kinase